MPNTSKQRPIARTASTVEVVRSDYQATEGEFGPVQHVDYTLYGRTYRHAEITWGQQEQITSMLLTAGAMEIMSFNDVAAKANERAFRAALEKGKCAAQFLRIVLRSTDGAALPEAHFTNMPAAAVEQLIEATITDFFTLSPSALNGSRELSGPLLGLQAVRELIGKSATSSVTGISPGFPSSDEFRAASR